VAARRFKIGDLTTKNQPSRLTAAALAYTPGEEAAPRVMASGQGKIAEKILTLARLHGIPIHEDPALAAALSALNPGDEIPPELYAVVAAVLVYIYRVLGKRGNPHQNTL
jgi:flagellar biosynthesis protein